MKWTPFKVETASAMAEAQHRCCFNKLVVTLALRRRDERVAAANNMVNQILILKL